MFHFVACLAVSFGLVFAVAPTSGARSSGAVSPMNSARSSGAIAPTSGARSSGATSSDSLSAGVRALGAALTAK